MGILTYDEHPYALEDRLLAHLQVVISLKLRRREGFFLSWGAPADEGGRHSIWIDNGVSIRFQFDGSRPPSINRDWVETLVLSANTNSGLVLTAEGRSDAH